MCADKKAGEFGKNQDKSRNAKTAGPVGSAPESDCPFLQGGSLQTPDLDSAMMMSIVESLPDPVFIKDRSHRWVFVNQAFCNFMGYSREELIGKSDGDFFPRAQAEVFWRMDNMVFESGRGNENEEFLTDSQGFTHVIRTKKTILRNSDNALFLIGVIRDVTQQKMSELALRDSEEKLRAIFDAAKDAIFMKDRELRYILINRATETLLNLSVQDIIGKTDMEIFGAEVGQSTRELDQRVFEGVTVENESYRQINGKVMTLHIIKVPVFDSLGRVKGICGIARDITATKRLEESMQQTQKLEALGSLAGGVAHDFNNLLTGINGYLYLIRQKIQDDHPISPKLNSMQHLIERGTSLTRQLLGFARARSLETVPTDLNDVIKTASKIFERTKREIRMERYLFQGLWNVTVDPAQIEQVLLNLFINAWQAMPQGGTIRIDTRNLVIPEFAEGGSSCSVPPGSYVVIGVQDNGQGMDEDTRKRIFEPFFTTKGVGGGTGLGLASAYGIIRNHGGYISVESELEKGARFEIFLPTTDTSLNEPQDEEPQKKSAEPKRKKTSKKAKASVETGSILKKRDPHTSPSAKAAIMLIDDEDNVRNVMAEMLESLGYSVDTFADGESGTGNFRKNPSKYDLVILDVILPGMGGEEIYRELRSIRDKVKVLLCTGFTQKNVVERLISQGCLGYIQKPFDIGTLETNIQRALKSDSAPGGDQIEGK